MPGQLTEVDLEEYGYDTWKVRRTQVSIDHLREQALHSPVFKKDVKSAAYWRGVRRACMEELKRRNC